MNEEAVERAARRLAQMNLDGLPDWDADLSEETRYYWRHEAYEALAAAGCLDTTTEWAVQTQILFDGPWDRIYPMSEADAREQIRRAHINAERRGTDPWERLVSRQVTTTKWKEVDADG